MLKQRPPSRPLLNEYGTRALRCLVAVVAMVGILSVTSTASAACGAVSDASYVSVTAQNAQAIIYWSSPNQVAILRKATPFAGEAPVNGTVYSAGSTIGAATVAYVGGPTASLTDTGLANGTTYYYKVFAYAAGPCYAPGTVNTAAGVSAAPSAGPTPAWSYAIAGGSILNPGIAGQGTIYTSSNANRIISLNTSDGTQSWQPAATAAAIQGWLAWTPDIAYLYRKPLTVTAGAAAVPSGYSMSLTFDHASLVTAGKSQANGNDVRVLYWSGVSWVQLDRVLDSGSAWNTATTKIWFQTQAAIGASGSDANYYLYYGNANAANPPANKANIFLFSDDFEAGNLAKWTNLGGGLWQVDGTFSHSGTHSLKYPSECCVEGYLVANPALNVGDVYLDSWWYSTNAGTTDIFGQLLRQSGGVGTNSAYMSVLINDPPYGWDISQEIGGTYTQLSLPAGTPAANVWTRVGTAISGTGMRVFINGAQVNPASGAFNVGTALASGNIGVGKYRVGTGWWIDDVILRRYVNPEPTSALGAEQPNSGGAVIGGDQGTGGPSTGTVYSLDVTTGVANWTVTPGGDMFQASASVQMRTLATSGFQSTYTTDVVFAATRNTSLTNNKIFALRATDGATLWTFNGTGTYSIDYIVGQPYVDYARDRLYVASRAGAVGTQQSLWVINTLNGALVQSLALGHLQASPTLSYDGNTVYVASTAGTLYAINANTLTQKWTFALGATAINGFVWEDFNTAGKLYFSTADGNVWSVQDLGATAVQLWKTAVAGAANGIPLDNYYVGSSDGKVHQLNLVTGLDLKQFPAVGALDGTTVGALSTETGNEIFAGTSGGRIFKIPVPLP
jgi:outer membrane protein assembly factor BamB